MSIHAVYRYCAYGILMTVPFYRWINLPVGGVEISIVDVMIFFGGLAIFAEMTLGRGVPLVMHRAALAGIGLLFFAIVVSSVQARNRDEAVVFLVSLAVKLVLLYVFFRATRDSENVRGLLGWYLFGAGMMAAVAGYQQLAAGQGGGDAVSVAGTLQARNELTLYLAPAVVLSVSLARTARVPVVSIVLGGFVIIGLILSRGRAGTFLGVMGVVLYVAYLAHGSGGRSVRAALAGTCILGAALAWVLTADSADWVRDRYAVSMLAEWEEQRGSVYMRLLVLEGLLRAWRENMWFGIGGGNFKARSEEFIVGLEDVQPHNTYLGAMAEMGIVGFVGLLLITLPVLRDMLWERVAHESKQAYRVGVAFAYVIVLAHLATFDGLTKYPLWIFAGVCYGLVSQGREARLRFW